MSAKYFGSDFITGFPTETEEQFQNTLDLVQKGNITHLHVFPYSERPGTPAAKMPQIPVNVRKERAARLRELGDQLYMNLLQKMVGTTQAVLVENDESGWTENYLRVILNTKVSPGKIVQVKIKGVENNALVG